jgi:hypothetical protein
LGVQVTPAGVNPVANGEPGIGDRIPEALIAKAETLFEA